MWRMALPGNAGAGPAEIRHPRDQGGHQPCRGGCDLSHAVLDHDRGRDGGRGVPCLSRLPAQPAAAEPRGPSCRSGLDAAAARSASARDGADDPRIDRAADAGTRGRDRGRDRARRPGHEDHDDARPRDGTGLRCCGDGRSGGDFFLAGHETSASALAWALYLLATHSEAQDRVAQEAAALPERPEFSDMRRLAFTRDVFREAMRLYPPPCR